MRPAGEPGSVALPVAGGVIFSARVYVLRLVEPKVVKAVIIFPKNCRKTLIFPEKAVFAKQAREPRLQSYVVKICLIDLYGW